MRVMITMGHNDRMASPTARRRRIGGELRRYRLAAEMTQEQAAERVEMTADQIVRIEAGRMVRLSVLQVRALLDTYGVDDPAVRAELEQWTREARTARGWWVGFRDVLDDKFAGLEDAAATIREYTQGAVPGLLQTDDYARAVFMGVHPKATPDEIERRAQARAHRREILDRTDPPDLWMVISEAVLRQMIGGRTVMADQLQHLADIAARPGITVQVLPFSAGAHAGIDGSFITFEFDPEDRPIGLVEGPMGTVYIEDPDDVGRCLYAHNQVCAAALPPPDSLRMIREVKEGLL